MLGKAESDKQGRIAWVSMIAEAGDSRNEKLQTALIEEGYSIDVVCSKMGQVSSQSVNCRFHLLGKVEYHFWQKSPLSDLYRALLRRLVNAAKALYILVRIRPALLIPQEPDSWVVCCLVKIACGGRIIVDLSEMYEDRALAFPRGIRAGVRFFVRGGMWLCSRFTFGIIQVNEERSKLTRFLGRPQTLVRLFPSVRLAGDAGRRRAIRQKLGVGDKCLFIHAGPLRPSYAGREILEALELVNVPVAMVVLGGIVGGLEKSALCTRLTSNGRLIVLDAIPAATVNEYLDASDVGINVVLPVDLGHTFAQPRKLYEYMAAGLPVIGSSDFTIKSVILEWHCGICVDPEMISSICNAMTRLSNNDDERRLMGMNGRNAIRECYCWSKERERFVLLVKDALCSR